MNIRNCTKCGKIFNYVAGKATCPNCRKRLEELFTITRHFIKKNPKASIAEISEACDVDVKQIMEWIREERLTFTDDSPIGIDCEVCGRSIKTGRYCGICKTEMVSNLNSAYQKEEAPRENPFAREKVAKMHFMDNKNKR